MFIFLIIFGMGWYAQPAYSETGMSSGFVEMGANLFPGYECARIYFPYRRGGEGAFDSPVELKRKGYFLREFPNDKAKILYFLPDDILGIKTGSKVINGYIEAVGYSGGGSHEIKTGWIKKKLIYRYHDSYKIGYAHNENSGCTVEFRVNKENGNKYIDFNIYNIDVNK